MRTALLEEKAGGFKENERRELRNGRRRANIAKVFHQTHESSSRRAEKLNSILEVVKAMAAQHQLDTLLPVILSRAAQVVDGDRCSLFLIDREKNELWSRVAQGVGEEIRLPMGQGIAGSVAETGLTINIANAYADSRFNRDFDAINSYRTRSILCVPMRDTRGEVVGVLQALNSENAAFDDEDEELLLALGGQAAQAIENVTLREEISNLFEGFVQASVMAIEQRDPTTAGHSARVAATTVALAQATEKVNTGPYKDTIFSTEQLQEIRYASLLHDFGKIGVREPVLVKAEKFYPHELEHLKQRFQLARKDRQLESMTRRLEGLKRRGEALLSEIEKDENELLSRQLRELDEAFQFILQCNRPTVLAQGGFERLSSLHALSFQDASGVSSALLTVDEIAILSIPKGSLSAEERKEIESHVTHTFHFLEQIPWTRSLKRVPEIAYMHHEKLNGKGYPRSVDSVVIPVQSKMMAIADIYDALTASDRPYKKAVPHEMALDIVGKEAALGQLDADLFQIFVEANVSQKGRAG
jgi:HD-GYP domain-containing protein (c-di-GMP phosphodiesterase class II)